MEQKWNKYGANYAVSSENEFIRYKVCIKICIMHSVPREYKCNKSADQFCYICGKWTKIKARRTITEHIKTLYRQYFNLEILHQDKCWVPHTVCSTCNSALGRWANGNDHLSFGQPMLWRDPINHLTNCYICKTNVVLSKKRQDNVRYATVDSVTLPVPHSANLPIPIPPTQCGNQSCSLDLDSDGSDGEDPASRYGDVDDDEDTLYIPDTSEPHLLTQAEFDDLVRDLYLTKHMSELLGSRLQQWKLLKIDVKITATRERSASLAAWFDVNDKICYCKNIPMLFAEMKQRFDPQEWRLFIDGSISSIKAVLLHIGNQKPSVPVAFAIGIKEEYSTMQKILQLTQYDTFRFKVIADFKVVGILMGLQGGNVKFPCFLCLWDSRAHTEHFKRSVWPKRTDETSHEYNRITDPLISWEQIILPPLHIKLGLMSNFVKALTKTNPEAIEFLNSMFPKLSELKIKQGIFVGPQIKQVLRSEEFKLYLTEEQKDAWKSFEDVVTGFLGNTRQPNYKELIDKMLENYGKIGANLSLKMHFLMSHKEFFPDNCGAYSDEHGERFHQDISNMEERFNGRYIPNMLGEYCWMLIRTEKAMHKRRSEKQHFRRHADQNITQNDDIMAKHLASLKMTTSNL